MPYRFKYLPDKVSSLRPILSAANIVRVSFLHFLGIIQSLFNCYYWEQYWRCRLNSSVRCSINQVLCKIILQSWNSTRDGFFCYHTIISLRMYVRLRGFQTCQVLGHLVVVAMVIYLSYISSQIIFPKTKGDHFQLLTYL